MGQPGPGAGDGRRVGQSIVRVRVDWAAVLVDADLDAAAVDIRRAIDAGRKINPCRHACRRKPHVTSRRAEVGHDLARRTDATCPARRETDSAAMRRTQTQTARQQLPHPSCERTARTAGVSGASMRARNDLHAALLEIRDQRSHGPARGDDAALPLEQRDLDAVGVELREAACQPPLGSALPAACSAGRASHASLPYTHQLPRPSTKHQRDARAHRDDECRSFSARH